MFFHRGREYWRQLDSNSHPESGNTYAAAKELPLFLLDT